jgi:hypothetical protein
MHIAYALFADAANLSQEGKLNVLGVFDAVRVSGLPSVHPRATLVVRLKGTRADIGRHMVTLRWLNPAGTELWSSTGELGIDPPLPGSPMGEVDVPLIASIDLPLDSSGAYTMQVAVDDMPHAELRLQVSAAPPLVPPSGMVS